MLSVRHLEWKLALRCAVALVLAVTIPSIASAQQGNAVNNASTAATEDQSRQALLDQLALLEKRIAELTASGAQASPVTLTAMAAQARAPQQTPQTPPMPPGMVMPAGPSPGANPANPEGTPADSTNPQDLLDRLKLAEQRIKELETSVVWSQPETRTKRVEVYVDKEGGVHDEPVPGARKTITYTRERVFRRQDIAEQIEKSLDDAAKHSVEVGVNAGIVSQFAFRTKGTSDLESQFSSIAKGTPTAPNHHAYELASADLFFTAGIAQNTLFFADVVGLSGPPPDLEVPTLTLVNGYSARLVHQNELNLREAWLRTEVFSQKLALIAGRLDLTNYFDHNMAANDETTQFISDALVNNPMLGLDVNGAGFAAVYDPKHGFNFKIGFQQSNTDAFSLNESIYSLAEVGFVGHLRGMGEGNYRAWYRTDNNGVPGYRIGYGTSIDQRLSPRVTLFGRFGAAQADIKRDHFYSGGLKFDNGLGFFPGDTWGTGYAQTDLRSSIDLPLGGKERLVEGFYNFSLSEKLHLSFHVQHFLELQGSGPRLGYLVPGIRLQASF